VNAPAYITEPGILPTPDAARLEKPVDEAIRTLTPRRIAVKVVDVTLYPVPRVMLTLTDAE
jgi:hypothetical protein